MADEDKITAKSKNFFVIIANPNQDIAEFNFLMQKMKESDCGYLFYDWRDNLSRRSLNNDVNQFFSEIATSNPSKIFYLLSNGVGANFVGAAQKNLKENLKAIFMISPFIEDKSENQDAKQPSPARMNKWHKNINDKITPIVIFNSNKDNLEYQTKLSKYIAKHRMVYNIPIIGAEVDIFKSDIAYQKQIWAAIAAYLFKP